jgi:hypothetical protein
MMVLTSQQQYATSRNTNVTMATTTTTKHCNVSSSIPFWIHSSKRPRMAAVLLLWRFSFEDLDDYLDG